MKEKNKKNTRTTSGTIFSVDVNKWRLEYFSIQTWCISLEAFASKNMQSDIHVKENRSIMKEGPLYHVDHD